MHCHTASPREAPIFRVSNCMRNQTPTPTYGTTLTTPHHHPKIHPCSKPPIPRRPITQTQRNHSASAFGPCLRSHTLKSSSSHTLNTFSPLQNDHHPQTSAHTLHHVASSYSRLPPPQLQSKSSAQENMHTRIQTQGDS